MCLREIILHRGNLKPFLVPLCGACLMSANHVITRCRTLVLILGQSISESLSPPSNQRAESAGEMAAATVKVELLVPLLNVFIFRQEAACVTCEQ